MKVSSIICVICFIVLIHPISIFATSNEDNWEKLDQISDQALQMVKQERYKDAKQLLSHFSNEFLEINQHERAYSMDELRVITVSHNKALEAVTSSSLSIEERVNAVTQFRLVIDAMRTEHQPMWTEMEDSIMTTFGQMKETVEQGDQETFNYQLNIFLSKYELIHPSIRVDMTPEDVQKLDSHITFLDHYRNQELKKATRLQQLEQMEMDLRDLFERMTKDDADPSLIWVMILTGSAIILTLTYVGWKKYKADKQKRQTQREYDDR
ncbi:sporulation protein YpjB [Fredinandcohnia sp. 179-A 10B2 NHS]|uniref:sporulation protein YpjB n=1 Tax=Fredinandcohnia sp. 179-A 10B2 NHS TaxID=3235176 RepID=UPI0039A3E56A